MCTFRIVSETYFAVEFLIELEQNFVLQTTFEVSADTCMICVGII